MPQESAKKELAKLISDYEEHRDQYLQKGYDEIKFRNNIVNRFFKIFGWDVDNLENLPEYNRDVYYSPKDLWSNTDIKMFKVNEKIISRQTSDRLIAALDTQKYFTKEKSAHDNIVLLVETLLELNKDLHKAKRPDEKDRLQNRITHSENRMDEIIYELYSINKKERAIIERNLSK